MVLAIAVVFTFMPMVTLTANAASKTPLVTKAVSDDGTTVKYSYNKKGLVKKAVRTVSDSSASSDWVGKTATTYKYNKKNKIKSETKTFTSTSTDYKTDNTTHKQRGESKGTTVYKNTSVTNYTYNKKGLATKAITTSTDTWSGSTTNSQKYLSYKGHRIYDKLSNGTYGYWDDIEEVFVPIDIGQAETKTSWDTTAYTDNGDGSYTESVTNSTGYSKVGTHKKQTVTTSSYTYKKKNVKTATVSRVVTTEDSGKHPDGSSYVTTTVTTYLPIVTSYKYKKGRVVKWWYTDPNTTVDLDELEDDINVQTMVSVTKTTNPDGTVDEYKEEYANGTITAYWNGKYDWAETAEVKSNPDNYSRTFKYDKKGNLKSEKGSTVNNRKTQLKDEAYDGISVFFLNSQSRLADYEVPNNSIFSFTTSVTTTVKKGTKRLLTRLGMTKNYKDGYAVDEDYYSANKSSYSMNRTKFTVKAKKVAKKAAKNVESQQWMIQNGVFQTVGLDL
jgi:hypothetical protein